jgi:hypothetical protein
MGYRLLAPHEIRLLLADLPPGEAQRIWQQALNKASITWRFWIGVLVAINAWLVGDNLVRRFEPNFVVLLVFGTLGARGVFAIMLRLWLPSLRERVRLELVAIGRCPDCGYDVRDIAGCGPECGWRIESNPQVSKNLPLSN